MFVYSSELFNFIKKIINFSKSILTKEMNLKVSGSRFLNEEKTHSFPLSVLIFTHSSKLAFFDPTFFELGFNEKLLYCSDEILKNIIRHELAHYFTYITWGQTPSPHGVEFLKTCRKFNWDEQISKATICDKDLDLTGNKESEIIRKVKKLLALGSSSNPFEAEAAIMKAQNLLTNHQIESLSTTEDSRIYVKKILIQKKQTPKLRAIGKILETFYVNTIYKGAKGFCALEIIGMKENVEIAEYVGMFLETEFENLWVNSKKMNSSLNGSRDKNSFFLGIAIGYCNKVETFKKALDPSNEKRLLVLNKSLTKMTEQIYPKLKSIRTHQNFSRQAGYLGEKAGQNLVIKPAISNNNSCIKNLTAGTP